MVGAIWGFGGAIVLLLLGSAILEWYWVAALFVAGVAVSAWRTWRRIPQRYAIAQLIDERMRFHDAISTAYHFRNNPGHAPEAVLNAQREVAERLAATADAAVAVPFGAPRQAYVALGVAAVALSILVVRYGVLGTLELRAPIVEAVADFFSPSAQVVARNKQKQPRLPGEEPMTLPVDQLIEQRAPLDQAPDSALDTVDIPETSQGEAKDAERTQKQQMKGAGQQGDEMAEGGEGERKGEEGKEGSDGKEGKESAGDKSGKEPGEAQKPNQQGSGRENSSMMDKMRDAMANLMAKLKIPPQAGQQGNNQKGNQQQGQKDQGGGQKGEKGEGQQQGKGTPSDDPNAEEGDGEQQAQAGQGKSADKGSEQGSPNESKSGMGKQDGNKDVRDAEQLAAMGKISEIFGKRAQNMTGEVMVEVSSGKNQQLKTAYTERGATHKEAGGEIHRDEIPLVFQHYVQKYFEQVRQGEARQPAGEPKK